MAKISITRTNCPMPANIDDLKQYLFSCIKGINPDEDRAWRRFWSRVNGLDAGEITSVEAVFPRNGKFHRKFFALLDYSYEIWTPPRKHKKHKGMAVSKSREQFREDILILAGFYESTFDLKGRLKIRAQSISFAKMDDVAFEQVYSAVVDVLLSNVLMNFKTRADVDRVVERILNFA